MTVLASYPSLRYVFADKKSFTGSIEFTSGSPDRLTRSSGSWVTDGVVAGMYSFVSGATNAANNGRRLITEVDATNLRYSTTSTFVTEGPTANVTVLNVYVDGDGYERWPVSLLRASGFNGTLGNEAAIATLQQGLYAVNLTVNNYAADSVAGTDEYDWYLSQRTDNVGSQFLLMTTPTTGSFSGPSTYSGTVRIDITAAGSSAIGSPTPEGALRMWNRVHLYVRRRSDGAINWFDMRKLVLNT